MNLTFNDSNDFFSFKEMIRQRLAGRIKEKAAGDNTTPAAVMIILMNRENAAHVFLTRRTQNVRTHKGQVAFPGGAREKNEDILSTALRETFEETGIRPEHIEIIGEFDEYISISDFHVSTFVGAINYPYKYVLNKDEIDDCIEVPVSLFRNREYDKGSCAAMDRYADNNIYNYKGFSIWGLTARIMTEFAEKILY